MSTPVQTTTPTKAPAEPMTDSPGTWRHPRLDEIARRREATIFSDNNVKQIFYSFATLVTMWTTKILANSVVDTRSIPVAAHPYLGWGWFILHILVLFKIGTACLPLIRKEDDFADIPLTAGQRKLLGLPPTSTPATPGAGYSTPPRYSRTPSLAGSVGSRGSYPSSPLSNRGTPSGQNSQYESPYSPSGSPLFGKGSSSPSKGLRGSSFGSPGPFGRSSTSALTPDPTSPSPSNGKRMSVGLNSKWLYEKGRRSSSSSRIH